LTAGRKRTHWIWYVFPQVSGLGSSAKARFYAIDSAAEARAYLAHPTLGPRLVECAELMLEHAAVPVSSIMGFPDDAKFRSSMTLFAAYTGTDSVFRRCIDAFFAGMTDERTEAVLATWDANEA